MKLIAFVPWLGLVYVAIILGGFDVNVCEYPSHVIVVLMVFVLDVLQLSWERSQRMSVLNTIYSFLYVALIVWVLSQGLVAYDTNGVLLLGLTIIEILLTVIIGRDLSRLNVFATETHGNWLFFAFISSHFAPTISCISGIGAFFVYIAHFV